jgi:DNA-directed RNA polymerase specialized sigma subunit, sigma24 homolog
MEITKSSTISTKTSWSLSESTFRSFLDWLDGDEPSDGARYLEMRDRLAWYFDRKNCLNPDDLADETLNRVARRLEEEGEIRSDTPAKYCYTVARFVFLEYLRRPDGKNIALDEGPNIEKTSYLLASPNSDETELNERRHRCLEKCTDSLDPASRNVILRYYLGKQRAKIDNREALAKSLGITTNALTIRACRIRSKLESCVRKCVG